MAIEDGSGSTGGSIAASGATAALGGVIGSLKEKWDASGGQEVLSNVSSSIPQGTKDMLSKTTSKFFNRQHLRSPYVFFGVGEERPFYVERSPALLGPRLQHNLRFFYLNYMILTAILFVLTVIVSPSALVGMALLGVGWMSVIRATQEGSMNVKGVTISQKQATIGMSVVSVVVLFYLLSHIFWWTMFTSGFLVGSHAVLRDASMHKDEEDRVDMVGDLGEDASFLTSPTLVEQDVA
uniref:PRA1 family protein n=1 Tax=Trieres chinensis TaxID=1514140 RepID=A0A7S2ESH6_TRICV|mmetsp:Transcript_36930/g.75330  ORF Transcript_36930/g.75330 Transcript_36930/m.75330 type:complete len:238 (+) Transcript_36930:131-844(+)